MNQVGRLNSPPTLCETIRVAIVSIVTPGGGGDRISAGGLPGDLWKAHTYTHTGLFIQMMMVGVIDMAGGSRQRASSRIHQPDEVRHRNQKGRRRTLL